MIQTRMGGYSIDVDGGVEMPRLPVPNAARVQALARPRAVGRRGIVERIGGFITTIANNEYGGVDVTQVLNKYTDTFSTTRVGAGASGSYYTAPVSRTAPFPSGGNSLPEAAPEGPYPGPVEQLITLPATVAGNVSRKTGISPLVIAGGAVAAVLAAYAVTR